MRQRVITVPKDKIAEKALDFDEATKEQLIELPIGEKEFLFLCQNGIIELINNEGGSNIDDFEDDSVIGKANLNRVIRALSALLLIFVFFLAKYFFMALWKLVPIGVACIF